VKLNTLEYLVCPSEAWYILVENWETAKLKCSEINVYIPKSRNYGAVKIMCCSTGVVSYLVVKLQIHALRW